jgi:hypothetical protein
MLVYGKATPREHVPMGGCRRFGTFVRRDGNSFLVRGTVSCGPLVEDRFRETCPRCSAPGALISTAKET